MYRFQQPPTVDASATERGLMGIIAQIFAGAKTFLALATFSAGITVNGATTITGNGSWSSSAASSVFELNESYMKGARGTAKWSLNEAGGGTAQLYNTSAGAEITTLESRLYGRSTGASDIAIKAGTITVAGSVHDSAKLFSIVAGIGGTETEYAWFKKVVALGQGVLTLDGKNTTNAITLALINQGIGYSGITFEGLAGVMLGLGSAGTRGFQVSATNRTQSWYVNSGAYSASARAIYDWESVEDAYQKTIPFLRYQADAAHTADLARWFVGASTQVAGLTVAGSFSGASFVPTGFTVPSNGLFLATTNTPSISAASTEIVRFNSGSGVNPRLNTYYAIYLNAGSSTGIGFGNGMACRLTTETVDGASAVAGIVNTTTAWSNAGAKLWSFQTNAVEKASVYADGVVEAPGFRIPGTITDISGTPGDGTVNAYKGRAAVESLAGVAVITNNKVTVNSVVTIMWETTFPPGSWAVVPAAGSFTVQLDGSGFGDLTFRFVVH